MTSRKGTPIYIAPEILNRKYTEKCDMWSAGVVLYVLLCGYLPFQGKTEKQIYENIKLGFYSTTGEEWAKVSPEVLIIILIDHTKFFLLFY